MSERTLSDRAAFYLNHRQRIEEWAALKPEVEKEAHRFYCTLVEPLEDACSGLPDSPLLFTYLAQTEPPKIFLVDRSWSGAKDGDHPKLGIGLEWSQHSPTFTNAYMGIWVNRYGPHLALAERICPLIADDARKTLSVGGKSPVWPQYTVRPTGSWWPVHRFEKPPRGDYWVDLDGYASVLVDRICAFWTEMSKSVQASFEKTKEENA